MTAQSTPPRIVQGYEPVGRPLAQVTFVSGVDLPGRDFGKFPRADSIVVSDILTLPAARGTYQARKENAYDLVDEGASIAVRCVGSDWWARYPMHQVKMLVPAPQNSRTEQEMQRALARPAPVNPAPRPKPTPFQRRP